MKYNSYTADLSSVFHALLLILQLPCLYLPIIHRKGDIVIVPDCHNLYIFRKDTKALRQSHLIATGMHNANDG